MFLNPKLGGDLKDVLETLELLKQGLEKQAKDRAQLEAEKAALTRRLAEALTAERRQRCRATSSRTLAKRAQAAARSVVATHKELAILKRELIKQKNNFEQEKSVLEDKIAALQLDNKRLKDEAEAVIAAVEFAKEDATFSMSETVPPPNRYFEPPVSEIPPIPVLTRTTPPTSTPVVVPVPQAPIPECVPPVSVPTPISPTLVPVPVPETMCSLPAPTPSPVELPSRPPLRNINSLWTKNGQLVWNPSPINLTSGKTAERNKPPQYRPRQGSRKTAPLPSTSLQYPSIAGFHTASQLMSHSLREDEICSSQISQSDFAENKRSQENNEDCVIIEEEVETVKCDRYEEEKNKHGGKKVKMEAPPVHDNVVEIVSPSVETSGIIDDLVVNNTSKTPVKKVRKKRKMYCKSAQDDFID